MSEVTTIGLDIAKNVFHAHGADERGACVFSKRITRGKLLDFFAAQPRCVVALEACGGAHHWARELVAMGHEVRLIPPAYVKPFVKRSKNDAVDAEAICEAAQRPTMRFVAVKSEEQQAAGLVFRTRDLLVRQRTQSINAIRGHLAEYGWVAPKGRSHVACWLICSRTRRWRHRCRRRRGPMFQLMVDLLGELDRQIAELDKEIARRAREDEVARRLMTIPGIGPITATAIAALAPPAETFTQGPRLRRLAGAHAAAEVDRRQAEAGRDLEDGRANAEAAADHRQQRGRAPGEQARRAGRLVARADAGAQAAHAGDGGARQQDGAHRLGAAREAGGLQSSGRGRRRKPRRTRGRRRRSRSKEGMAQQSARRDRKNQGFPPCHQARFG